MSNLTKSELSLLVNLRQKLDNKSFVNLIKSIDSKIKESLGGKSEKKEVKKERKKSISISKSSRSYSDSESSRSDSSRSR
jgi:hypothetical protein